jgi:uncharacterized protein YbjT (DUF2867 family)
MPVKPLHSGMQPYSAVVLGSTGNVGRQIVNLLVASPAVRQGEAICGGCADLDRVLHISHVRDGRAPAEMMGEADV